MNASGADSHAAIASAVLDWLIPSRDLALQDARLLGEGYFGKVYQARWKEMQVLNQTLHGVSHSSCILSSIMTAAQVAVKVMKNVRAGEIALFWKEVSIFSTVSAHSLILLIVSTALELHALAVRTRCSA